MPWLHEMINVDVSRLPHPDIPRDWKTTKSYTREQIEQYVRDLQEVQRLTREQKLTRDDFLEMADSDDAAKKAVGRAYKNFYERDCGEVLKLSMDGRTYDIENGQHRIAVMKELGVRHAPAFVSAPDEATMKRLRAESDRLSQGEDPRVRTLERQNLPPWERRRDDEPRTRSLQPQRQR